MDPEFAEALDGCNAGTAVRFAREAAERFVAKCLSDDTVRQLFNQDAKEEDMRESLLWALSIVMSRAIVIGRPSVDAPHQLHDRPLLVPGADLLNHNPDATARWSFARDGPEAFRLTTETAVPRSGREVFNHYGALDNAQLLAHFGFALPINRDDRVSITIAHASREPSRVARIRERLLAALRTGPAHRVGMSGPSTAMLNAARILALQTTQLDAAALDVLRIVNGDSPSSTNSSSLDQALDRAATHLQQAADSDLVVPLATELRALEQLQGAMRELLSRYDAARVQRVAQTRCAEVEASALVACARTREAALLTIDGERTILRTSLNRLDERLRDLGVTGAATRRTHDGLDEDDQWVAARSAAAGWDVVQPRVDHMQLEVHDGVVRVPSNPDGAAVDADVALAEVRVFGSVRGSRNSSRPL